MLLKEFEKRENSFANKVNTKLSEKDEMQEKVRGTPAENVRKVDCRAIDWHNNAPIKLSYPNLIRELSMSGYNDSDAIGTNLSFLCLPIAFFVSS